MILVTVGTHDQQFNRLVSFMDVWAGENDEQVIIQRGCSKVEPRNCVWKNYYPYQIMQGYMAEARIVITHGGPSSFVSSLQLGKIPIVVPRKKAFGEHVNDHQVIFARECAKRNHNIIVVENIEELGDIIAGYPNVAAGMKCEMPGNNAGFCKAFRKIIDELVRRK